MLLHTIHLLSCSWHRIICSVFYYQQTHVDIYIFRHVLSHCFARDVVPVSIGNTPLTNPPCYVHASCPLLILSSHLILAIRWRRQVNSTRPVTGPSQLQPFVRKSRVENKRRTRVKENWQIYWKPGTKSTLEARLYYGFTDQGTQKIFQQKQLLCLLNLKVEYSPFQGI